MKPILDACCGSRMFWFDKQNPHTVYCDVRTVPRHEYYEGRYIEINPDVVADFTDLPFADKSFKLVVFDPPPFNLGRTVVVDGAEIRTVRR